MTSVRSSASVLAWLTRIQWSNSASSKPAPVTGSTLMRQRSVSPVICRTRWSDAKFATADLATALHISSAPRLAFSDVGNASESVAGEDIPHRARTSTSTSPAPARYSYVTDAATSKPLVVSPLRSFSAFIAASLSAATCASSSRLRLSSSSASRSLRSRSSRSLASFSSRIARSISARSASSALTLALRSSSATRARSASAASFSNRFFSAARNLASSSFRFFVAFASRRSFSARLSARRFSSATRSSSVIGRSSTPPGTAPPFPLFTSSAKPLDAPPASAWRLPKSAPRVNANATTTPSVGAMPSPPPGAAETGAVAADLNDDDVPAAPQTPRSVSRFVTDRSTPHPATSLQVPRESMASRAWSRTV
mmetsp:Transcript_7797/g.34387  ORF Transcript_7797/g.34387 Transcript_7797/m.34387 type:complete len:369 (+) Transcript_7797:1286-2392(+)